MADRTAKLLHWMLGRGILGRWTRVWRSIPFALALIAVTFLGARFLPLQKLVPDVHLAVLVSVLAVETYMLFIMRRELQEREATLKDLQNVRIALGRADYMAQIASAIFRAESRVAFTTTTMEASWNSNEQKRILDSVTLREARGSYEHLGIVAERPEALPGAVELLCRTKVKVRMSPILAMTRLRFLVRDTAQSILGVAESESDLAGSKPTTMSFSVESKMLAMALLDKFDALWKQSIEPGTYLDEMIRRVKQTSGSYGYTREEVRRWLRLDIDDDAKLVELSAEYKSLPQSGEPAPGKVSQEAATPPS